MCNLLPRKIIKKTIHFFDTSLSFHCHKLHKALPAAIGSRPNKPG